jgi:hypothetical protein
MLSPIKRFFKALQFALLWDKAVQRACRKEYSLALVSLRKIYAVWDTDGPSDRVPCDVNVLCGNVASKVDDYDLSLAATSTAVRQLSQPIRHFSRYDRDYLRYYCKIILSYWTVRGKIFDLPPDLWPIGVDLNSLQVDRVRPDILRNFPV